MAKTKRKPKTMFISVLADGETWTEVDGCTIQEVVPPEDPCEYGDADDFETVLRRWQIKMVNGVPIIKEIK